MRTQVTPSYLIRTTGRRSSEGESLTQRQFDLFSRLSKEGLGSRILHQTHHFLTLGQPLINSITITNRNQPLYSIWILQTSFWKESTKYKIVQFSKHWDLTTINLPVITTDKSWWSYVPRLHLGGSTLGTPSGRPVR